MDISPKLVSALIGAVYDCALNPSRWENALGEMVTALECHNALLSLTGHALRSPASHAQLWHERGMVRAFQDKHVPEVAAQLSRIIATWLPDKPFVMSRDLSPDIVQNSAYIEDAFRPEGIVDVLQCFLVGSPKRFAGLALGRRQPPGIFSDRDVELAGLLLPHIRRPSLRPQPTSAVGTSRHFAAPWNLVDIGA